MCNKQLLGRGKDAANIVQNPTGDGHKVLFSPTELHKDDVYDRLLPFKDDILGGKVYVSHHKSCCSGYVSKSNLKHVHGDGLSN